MMKTSINSMPHNCGADSSQTLRKLGHTGAALQEEPYPRVGKAAPVEGVATALLQQFSR